MSNINTTPNPVKEWSANVVRASQTFDVNSAPLPPSPPLPPPSNLSRSASDASSGSDTSCPQGTPPVPPGRNPEFDVLDVSNRLLSFPGLSANNINIVQGLLLPNTLNALDASRIALDYANASRDLIHAEAVVAERRYRRHRLAADAYKLHLQKLRVKHAHFEHRVGQYRDLVCLRTGKVFCIDSKHQERFPEVPSDPGNVFYISSMFQLLNNVDRLLPRASRQRIECSIYSHLVNLSCMFD
jgi:hypothetical protein